MILRYRGLGFSGHLAEAEMSKEVDPFGVLWKGLFKNGEDCKIPLVILQEGKEISPTQSEIIEHPSLSGALSFSSLCLAVSKGLLKPLMWTLGHFLLLKRLEDPCGFGCEAAGKHSKGM